MVSAKKQTTAGQFFNCCPCDAGSDVMVNDQAAGGSNAAVAVKYNPSHTTESNFGRSGTNTSTATTYNGRERKTPGGNSQIRFG